MAARVPDISAIVIIIVPSLVFTFFRGALFTLLVIHSTLVDIFV
jgi:hypothetical protein